MQRSGVLNEARTINGTYGELHHEGIWQTNFYKMSADIEISYADVKRSGTRWAGSKATSVKGSGSISGYKVTSELAQRVGQVCDDSKGEFITELISKLADPEAFGYERIRLKNVKFSKIPLINWEVESLVEEEWPFVFSDYEYLDPIVAG